MVDFDSNVNLVYMTFNQWYWMYGWLEEDLIQEGMIGLWKACQTFDVTRGNLFSTYAVKCIKNEMGMFLRKESRYFSRVESLDAKIDNDGKSTFLETIEAQEEGMTDYEKYVLELAISKAKELGFWNIVELRLKGMQQVDIAKQLGIHQVTVSERMNKLYAEVRKELEKEF